MLGGTQFRVILINLRKVVRPFRFIATYPCSVFGLGFSEAPNFASAPSPE